MKFFKRSGEAQRTKNIGSVVFARWQHCSWCGDVRSLIASSSAVKLYILKASVVVVMFFACPA